MLENLRDKITRYFWFTPTEWRGYWLTVLVASFVYSFDKWGLTTFEPDIGLINWMTGALLFGFIIFIHHAAQRIAALHFGFQPEHYVWWYGLVGSLLIALLTNGYVKWYAMGGLMISLLPTHRLGRYRYGPNLQAFANVTAFGPIANVCAAAFIKTLAWILPLPTTLVDTWFYQSLVYSAWQLLPFPPLDGSRMLYASRLFYVFVFSTFLGYITLAAIGVFSFVFALLIGMTCWLLFYYYVER
ncbi:hypothetical protein HY490_05575 [Candidatus Woesearchaeota archaeon]|nr:hypothetical protein [Candidatus Woesearchaeota archaeon]